MLKKGPQSLSDTELLSVLLGSGTAGCNVFLLASHVLQNLEISNYEAQPKQLMQINGMGPAKATLLAAAIEFGRRIVAPEHYRIKEPKDAIPLLQHYADRQQEHFISMSLNGAHEVIGTYVVSVGLVNRTLVHPREVFASALTDRAASIIVAHNHPSGNVAPSEDDIAVTKSLVQAGSILGITVLDHIIFSSRAHYSFSENDHL